MLKFEEDFQYFIGNEELLKKDIIIENEVLIKVTPQTFTDYKNLIHESPRICSVCDKVFPNSFTYLQHNSYHLSIPLTKIHTCAKCTKCFATSAELLDHICCSTKSAECHICQKTVSRKYLSTHIKNVHGSDSETCALCSKTFKSPYLVKRHRMFAHDKVNVPWRCRANAESGRVACIICKKMLRDKYALTTHVSNCHGREAQCDVCGKRFTSESYRNSHKLRVHDVDGAVYACSECGKSCKSQRRLRIHKYNSHSKCS